MATPHDALFKRVFSQPRHAASELRYLLPPPVVAQIDWQTLALVSGSVVDPQHRDRHADLLYTVKVAGQRAFLYVLFEHKSRPETLTPFQLLVYEVRIWERFLAQNPRSKTLPMIVPGVVPPDRLARLEKVPTWDEWDPDDDRWYYDHSPYAPRWQGGRP